MKYRITLTYIADSNDLSSIGPNDTETEAIEHIKWDLKEDLEFLGHTYESFEVVANPL